jgi:hypothetical protein
LEDIQLPLESVFTAVLTALGALIAAWMGTMLGLRKFRKERAFDARLEWHRKLAETAKILRNRTRAFLAFKRGGTPMEVVLPLVQELGELSFTFQELAEQASLYATNRTYSEIRDVLEEMTKVSQAYANYEEHSKETIEQSQAMYTSTMHGLERVYNLLARDLREMFGLDELEEHRLSNNLRD